MHRDRLRLLLLPATAPLLRAVTDAMDPVGEAGAFLQSYGWYCVGAALVVVFVVRPKLEELSHARSLAAAQNPARREALDRKRRVVVDRQQHTLAEDVKNNPPPPKPKPKPRPKPDPDPHPDPNSDQVGRPVF